MKCKRIGGCIKVNLKNKGAGCLCDDHNTDEYRFVFCPAVGASQVPFYGDSVPSQELAEGQLNIIANYTLHLHNENLMQDYSNIGYIEKLINDDWEELEEV